MQPCKATELQPELFAKSSIERKCNILKSSHCKWEEKKKKRQGWGKKKEKEKPEKSPPEFLIRNAELSFLMQLYSYI